MAPGWRRMFGLVVLLAACGGGSGGDFAVTCHVATRSAPDRGQPSEAQPVELVPQETAVVEGDDGLVWRATDSSDPGEGRAVSVQVVDDHAEPVAGALFQLDGRPGNDFRGGHGFTGLQYATGPSGASVQWWCTAD